MWDVLHYRRDYGNVHDCMHTFFYRIKARGVPGEGLQRLGTAMIRDLCLWGREPRAYFICQRPHTNWRAEDTHGNMADRSCGG